MSLVVAHGLFPLDASVFDCRECRVEVRLHVVQRVQAARMEACFLAPDWLSSQDGLRLGE